MAAAACRKRSATRDILRRINVRVTTNRFYLYGEAFITPSRPLLPIFTLATPIRGRQPAVPSALPIARWRRGYLRTSATHSISEIAAQSGQAQLTNRPRRIYPVTHQLS